jgi:hypothetical protein
MFVFSNYMRLGGMVEGLGDEEIPWWLAPYVRDFAALAKSSALIDAQRNATAVEPALASLTLRLVQTAAVARVAAHVKGNEGMSAGVSGALTAEIDEYCGTPPRPHHLNQAGLMLALLAASLETNDPAKLALVAQAERLQRLRGQLTAAA